jgi:acetyl-CoA carboxylase carboxyltransferase component
MRKVIARIVDNGEFFEIKPEFAERFSWILSAWRRYRRIVANQPMVMAGSLTADSSVKEARFIRFCDAFNIPLLMLIDTPAYIAGSAQEHKELFVMELKFSMHSVKLRSPGRSCSSQMLWRR